MLLKTRENKIIHDIGWCISIVVAVKSISNIWWKQQRRRRAELIYCVWPQGGTGWEQGAQTTAVLAKWSAASLLWINRQISFNHESRHHTMDSNQRNVFISALRAQPQSLWTMATVFLFVWKRQQAEKRARAAGRRRAGCIYGIQVLIFTLCCAVLQLVSPPGI